jgi:flavin reductase
VTALSAAARVMASFVTGVTVITTQVRGEIRGMTANAFMSGSLEPPLCVVSVGKKARMHTLLLESGHFGVNILARGQGSADRSLRRPAGRRNRSEIRVCRRHTPLRARDLVDRCQGDGAARVGDHSLFIGHIFALRHSDGLSPVVLHTGKLASLMPHEKTIWPTLDFW